MSSAAAPALILVVKVTILATATVLSLRALHRTSAAVRQLVCLLALCGIVAMLPFTLLPTSLAVPIEMSMVAASTSVSSPGGPGTFGWMAAVAAVWIAGTLAAAARIAGGVWLLRRVGARSTVDGGGEWSRDLSAAARTLGIHPTSAGVRFGEVHSPLSSGLLRPLILIPNEAKFWDSDRRRAILLHELAHIRRHDLWANAVAAVATALFWFHPLVWMLARRMRAEQELACDDVVLNEGIVPTSYAELLLDSASGFRSTALFGCAMAGSGAFKYRLVHVLDRARLRATTRTALVSAGLALLAAVVALGLMQPAMAQGVHEIGGKVKPPELIQKVEPSYTEEAKDAKIQGRVVVRVIVGTDGKIREPRIVTSLDPGLDANAIEALEQWLFKPATREGEPVAVRAQVEMNFRLF